MKVKNIAWGLFFVAAAALIILSQTNILEGLSFWSMAISLLMVPIIVKSIAGKAFGGILIPSAIILIAFDDFLGIERFTPWPVLICAVFLSVGLHVMFPYKKEWKIRFDEQFDTHIAGGGVVETNWTEESTDGEHVFFSNRFAGSVKYMTSEPFQDVNIRSSFGGTKIYFDSAVMKEEQAAVNIDSEFSGVELYIPKEWTIVNKVNYSFGGLDEKGLNGSTKNGQILVLNGRVRFSGVTVHYV